MTTLLGFGLYMCFTNIDHPGTVKTYLGGKREIVISAGQGYTFQQDKTVRWRTEEGERSSKRVRFRVRER